MIIQQETPGGCYCRPGQPPRPTPVFPAATSSGVGQTGSGRRIPQRLCRIPLLLCLLLGAPLLALAGCSVFAPPVNVRGNAVDPSDLARLQPGVTTESDTLALFGPPSGHDVFNDHIWFYVMEVTRSVIGGLPTVVKQQAVVLTFDSTGVLASVETYGKKDAYDVAMAPGATPSPGGQTTILQEILGRVGHIAPPTGANGGP